MTKKAEKRLRVITATALALALDEQGSDHPCFIRFADLQRFVRDQKLVEYSYHSRELVPGVMVHELTHAVRKTLGKSFPIRFDKKVWAQYNKIK